MDLGKVRANLDRFFVLTEEFFMNHVLLNKEDSVKVQKIKQVLNEASCFLLGKERPLYPTTEEATGGD